MIPVTKPFLPPIEEYKQYIDGIWQSQWLTNMGPLATELEIKLQHYLGLKQLLFVTNGTMALQMAIKALGIKDEIITTPFSFVATTSSIVWEGCTPVFVDIDRDSLCIDPTKIEEAITDKTSAILATHVYGNPCDVEALEKIAQKYNIKLIFDAAHSFGVEINGKSVFEYGDISICSTHATKLYHSIEGGFIATKDVLLSKKLASMRNFGISDCSSFSELGVNGKNSEFHAAMGLVNLNYVKAIHNKQQELTENYDIKLKDLKAVKPFWHKQALFNYQYYPVVFESEELLLKIKAKLDAREIFTRRYFYPSLASSLPYLEPQFLPITDNVSKRVLCLPLYYDLTLEEVDMICRLMLNAQNN